MARLPYAQPGTAPEPVGTLLSELPTMTIFRMLGNATTLFGPWLKWAGAVLNKTTLDPTLRQLAILRVAALVPGADYVRIQHEGIARALGATEQQIEGANRGSGLEGDDALIAELADAIAVDCAPSDELWERGLARFSPRELVELVLILGQYMMVARIAATVHLDLDEPQGLRGVEALSR
jgi:alkylhydroperoxidase family enzyme